MAKMLYWPGMACLALTLSGCIPAPLGKYYKPNYPDPSASYAGAYCSGKAGAPVTLTFNVADGVTISVNAQRSYGEKNRPDLPLNIVIAIPQHTEIQFISDELTIAESADSAGRKLETSLNLLASRILPSQNVVDLQSIGPTPQLAVSSANYVDFKGSLSLNFSWKDNFVPDEITLDLPVIKVVDSAQGQVKPISIEAKAKKRPETYPGQYRSQTSLIYTTREAEQATEDKYARCLKETPELRCKQILLYDEGRYKAQQSGFAYSGRLYLYDVEKNTPFSGEVNIEYHQPVKWQFTSNTVTVRDHATQGQRTYHFEQFPFTLSYRVPLPTALLGVNDNPYSKVTTAHIRASLGSNEAATYRVQLPAMKINGKLHQLKPIEIELRRLDFSIEPFNC